MYEVIKGRERRSSSVSSTGSSGGNPVATVSAGGPSKSTGIRQPTGEDGPLKHLERSWELSWKVSLRTAVIA